MMLRRRTERKAKVAASSLFKRVASGQDWNPSSPSTFIPVKRSSPKSKTGVANSAKVVKSMTSSSKLAADSLKKESSRTQQKSSTLQKKGDTRVQEKSDTMPKKGTAKLLQKTSNSHKKGVEVSQKQVRSVKKIDPKTQVKPSALPKKEDTKVLPKLGISPRKESVAVPVKAVVSPKKEDSLMPQKSCTTPKKEDGKLPQKLVVSPKKAEVESLPMTDVKKIPCLEKLDDIRCGDKPDKCVKKKVTSRSEKERSSELKKDPKDVVISASPLKHETSPVKEATESKTDSGLACHARKRKLEHEVESLMAEANDVCVKLTKLDEKTLTIDDQTSDRTEGQGQATDGETREVDLSSPHSAQVAHEQMDRNAIAYPSDCCPSVNFLAMIGLVPKSDIKKLEGSPNKLHREAGGKLRRILKPRLMPGMVYRKMTIAKGLSLTGIVIDHHQSKPCTKSVTSAPSAMQNTAQSRPKVSTFSAVTKFTLLRKDAPPLHASPKLSKTRTTPKPEVETLPLESKPEDPDTGVVVGVDEKMREEVAATPPDDKSTKETKEVELDNVAVVQSPAKQKIVPKKKTEPMKPCSVPNVTSDLEPVARRSARQQGNKRRVWGHLLRANPDEFEESNKWDTSGKDPSRNLPKTHSLEDGAKKPTDKSTNDDLTVVDVVGSASSVQEKTSKEGKPVQDSVACETESTQEPDSSRTESSFASLVVEAPAETPCPSQSTPERKSTPGKKPALLTGKRQKKVLRDGVGKSPRTSKTLGLADKSKATEKTEEENRVSKSRSESKVKSLDVLAFSNYSFLSYRGKDTDCQTPHMCSVCWVNDHMYCRNMKRTTNDLPPFGGCIHYIPCSHYWPPSTPSLKRSSSEHNSFHNHTNFVSSTFGVGDRSEGSSMVERSWNDDDLMCREEMIDSDSESHSPVPPQGTEILGIQLKTRADQIIRSLGIERMPESLDRREGVQVESSQDLDKEEEEQEDCNVVVEEYGAELCIDNVEEDDDFQEHKIETQKDSLGDPTCKLPSVEGQGSGLAVNGSSENICEVFVKNCDIPSDNAVCGVPMEFASSHTSSNLCVIRVQVQKLDSDRVRVTYPKILEGHAPGDDSGSCFIQKEVKFPTGADEKSLNEFLAQEAVRLVNEAPLEGQRKAAMGVKRAKSGSVEHRQDRGTKRSVATTTCPANQMVPSVMGRPKKKLKGTAQASGCSDQTMLARKESTGPHPRKRSRKLLCQSDLVLPPVLTADLELCGSDISARGTALPTEMECLPTITTGIEASAIVTSMQEFSLPGKASHVALEKVGPSVRALTKMDVTWSCSSAGIPAGDLAMLNSSSASHSANPVIPTVVTNRIALSVVHPGGCSAPGEIPDGVTSRPYTLGFDDQEGQSVSAYQDQVINVNLDQGSSFAVNNDQDIQSNRMVDFDPKTSVSPLVSDAGTSLEGPTVVFHPYSCIVSRPLPVYHEKDLKQSCIAQILQQQNSASSLQPIVNTLSSSRGTTISTASIPAKTSLAPVAGPRAILPCNPPSLRPQTCDSVGSVSTAHSSFTGVVPGAITRATGLVIPLGYSIPGPFVSVTGRLPPQLTHLPISAAVCNSRQAKPNCIELPVANMALANMSLSNAALTSITLASALPVKVAMGCTAPANLALANVASTNLTSASLASMNMVLKNVACPSLAATNVAFGNSSSLRKALANVASVNMTPTSMASVSVVPVSVAPVSMASVSMASSVNMSLSNMTSGNVACGNTIICMHPAGVGPPAMKITRLDHILAGNHGPPLLIAQTRSGMPNTIISTRPPHTDYHKAQSCATTVQSPSLNTTKHCITSPHPLTLAAAPNSDILQIAWNQCNDDCSGPVSCKVGSGANAICTVTSASNVSPTFFSVVDGSNVVV